MLHLGLSSPYEPNISTLSHLLGISFLCSSLPFLFNAMLSITLHAYMSFFTARPKFCCLPLSYFLAYLILLIVLHWLYPTKLALHKFCLDLLILSPLDSNAFLQHSNLSLLFFFFKLIITCFLF